MKERVYDANGKAKYDLVFDKHRKVATIIYVKWFVHLCARICLWVILATFIWFVWTRGQSGS